MARRRTERAATLAANGRAQAIQRIGASRGARRAKNPGSDRFSALAKYGSAPRPTREVNHPPTVSGPVTQPVAVTAANPVPIQKQPAAGLEKTHNSASAATAGFRASTPPSSSAPAALRLFIQSATEIAAAGISTHEKFPPACEASRGM